MLSLQAKKELKKGFPILNPEHFTGLSNEEILHKASDQLAEYLGQEIEDVTAYIQSNLTDEFSKFINQINQKQMTPVETPVDDFGFVRERSEKEAVDKFFKFSEDKVQFIGRFREIWTENDEKPFEGIFFTEGADVNSDIRVLIPSHTQLVNFFTESGIAGKLYRITRVEKIKLKNGSDFVKFAIESSNA